MAWKYSGGLMVLLLCTTASSSLNLASTTTTSNEPTGLSEQVVDQLSENDLYQANKRAWQSLQSSWGKRSNAGDVVGGFGAGGDDIYMTGHFVPLVVTDGTNTIDWKTFERMANQGQQQQGDQVAEQPQSDEEPDEIGDVEAASNNLLDKRAWKNMNVAWGKRRQAQGWNKFRGAWGKREPTWNNLKGMWGKRDQWQKLHGGWGKRSPMN
ncbi:uncharacterized protein Dwil_GK20345 [Drosophila willistoni]|uniref:GK20345 n=1 Tax=Drosophila willistoni TaxID=7260 RepID=B4N5C5_DROWI|nr:allatostatins MIP [Drosophila willistoni]EDW79564.1 uncharacterized protein Dwil_GK20345 [Drosophila willistoni]